MRHLLLTYPKESILFPFQVINNHFDTNNHNLDATQMILLCEAPSSSARKCNFFVDKGQSKVNFKIDIL